LSGDRSPQLPARKSDHASGPGRLSSVGGRQQPPAPLRAHFLLAHKCEPDAARGAERRRAINGVQASPSLSARSEGE
jgi:hypothetical protein